MINVKRWLREAVVFIPLAALFFAFAFFLNVRHDDAYIGYRYAENIANGSGPVYNVGEPVEGYTCVLWVLLLAAVSKAGLDVARMSVALGIGFGWLTIIATSWLVYQVSGEDARWRRWIPSFLVATCPFFAFNAGTGMETTLTTFLVTAALGFVLYERDKWCAPALLGLASLSRPDALLCAGAAFLYDARVRKLKKAMLRSLPLIILFGGQMVFRVVYYGDILPNTYYAKLGFSASMLVRGMRYALRFIRAWWYLPIPAIVAVSVFRRDRFRYGLLTAVVAVYTVYAIRVGGDFMPCFRFLLPMVPIMLVLVTESLIELTARIRHVRWRSVCRIASFALVVAVLGSQLQSAVSSRDAGRAWDLRKMDAARYFLQELPSDSLIATDGIGIVGYITKMPILDVLGKVDRHIAHSDVPMGSGFPGHEKYDADYVFERDPDAIFIPVSGEGRFIILPAWTSIWEHPLLHERYRVVRDSVTYYARKDTEEEARPGRSAP